ncbi:coiled-coil domain-containing protein mad1 [Savitreella phatthalungensis]
MPVFNSPGNPFAFSPVVKPGRPTEQPSSYAGGLPRPVASSLPKLAATAVAASTSAANAHVPLKKAHDLEIDRLSYELSRANDLIAIERIQSAKRINELEDKLLAAGEAKERVESDKRFLYELQTTQETALKAAQAALEETQTSSRKAVADAESKVQQAKDALISTNERHAIEKQADVRAFEMQSFELAGQKRALDALRADLSQKNELVEAGRVEVDELREEVRRLQAKQAQAVTDEDTQKFLERQLAELTSRCGELERAHTAALVQASTFKKAAAKSAVLQEKNNDLDRKLASMDTLRTQLLEAELALEMARSAASADAAVSSVDSERDKLQKDLDMTSARLKAAEAQLADEQVQLVEARQHASAREADAIAASDKLQQLERTVLRLERSKGLALKEVEFLREQLRSYDLEEELESPSFDRQRVQRIQELENLVDSYKAAVSAAPASQPADTLSAAANTGQKRRRESTDFNDIERGEYLRKLRGLAAELEITRQQETLAKSELEKARKEHTDFVAKQKQLLDNIKQNPATTASAPNSTTPNAHRVLEFKGNPTAKYQAVRTQQLADLQKENAALLDQLAGRSDVSVPIQSLRNAESEVSRLQGVVGQKEKMIQRLREVFAGKSSEFREAVFSLLGYKLDFLPNGRVRLTSMYADGKDCSFVFDGEAGTMQLTADPDSNTDSKAAAAGSPLGDKIAELVRFWSGEKHSIPAMLSALTLDLLDMSEQEALKKQSS